MIWGFVVATYLPRYFVIDRCRTHVFPVVRISWQSSNRFHGRRSPRVIVVATYNFDCELQSHDSKYYPPIPVSFPSIPIPRVVNEYRILGRHHETLVAMTLLLMLMMTLLLMKFLSASPSSSRLVRLVLLGHDPKFHMVVG